MSSISLNARFSQSSSQVSSIFPEETISLSLSNGRYYRINAVGTWIWERLETAVTGHQLVEDVVAAFQVDTAESEREVTRFLGDLLTHDLVQIADAD